MPLTPTAVRNPISIAGGAIATATSIVFLVVFFADLFGWHTNPYLGILFFLLLPALFLTGLALLPIGAWLERKRLAHGRGPMRWPSLDLNDPRQRGFATIVALITAANLVIVALATYRGIEFMDSVTFCGQVCHGPMQVEFAAYQDSPHSRVACVQCHIGPGAPWFVRAKISGTRQVFATAFNTYPRPIDWPVKNLRPARDTCEQCHWPEVFHGDKIVTVHEFSGDEKNTETVTTLQVHVGGGSDRLGTAQGIHWHIAVANEIEYIATDDKRQAIGYVKIQDRSGQVKEYFADGVTPDQLAKGERRRLDCVDCHNRPSHQIAPSAEKAVDAAMARGEIAPTLPFIERETVKVLKASYSSQQQAAEGIERGLRTFYRTTYPDVYNSRRQVVERAVEATVRVYQRNVFPDMKVQFGSFPSNIGHMDSPGCFRCHDENHKTRDGQAIGQDCDLCHDIK